MLNQDKFFQQYIAELRTSIEAQREGLCTVSPDKLTYHQGIIAGLREAMKVLEGVLEENDQ